MFPEDFIKRLDTQEYIDSGSLLGALEEPSPVSVIINRAKWDRVPGNALPVPWCNAGYYLSSRPSYTLDPLFHAGCYYPKEASGMFLDKIFEYFLKKVENLRVLDLCGAPGGKSIQISDNIGEGSLLISNEVIRSRASVLNETITKWGKGNTIVTQSDASAFGNLKSYFDVIVVDAPCSGEGMFRSENVRNEWSLENTLLCAARQKRILMEIWPSLKENGILIYSTCTFNPGENEENIEWLCRKEDVESLRIDLSPFRGITEIVKDDIYGYGFYPGKVAGEGFFISVVRKLSSEKPAQIKRQRKTESLPDKDDIALAEKWTTFSRSFFRKGDNLISGACSHDEYEFLNTFLNVLKGGTMVSTRMKNDSVPSHELALSQYFRSDSFPVINVGYNEAMAYLSRGDMKLSNNQKGWYIVKYEGASLGFVKNIGSRINNYYPVDWRVRMAIPPNGEEMIIKWIS